MQFAELTLPECVHKGITEAGFTECTPIQALSLPITLAGRDVAGQGQTGTGKTAAFLITLFNRLLKMHARKRAVLPETCRDICFSNFYHNT